MKKKEKKEVEEENEKAEAKKPKPITVAFTGSSWGFGLWGTSSPSWIVSSIHSNLSDQAQKGGVTVGLVITHVDGTVLDATSREALEAIVYAGGDHSITFLKKEITLQTIVLPKQTTPEEPPLPDGDVEEKKVSQHMTVGTE